MTRAHALLGEGEGAIGNKLRASSTSVCLLFKTLPCVENTGQSESEPYSSKMRSLSHKQTWQRLRDSSRRDAQALNGAERPRDRDRAARKIPTWKRFIFPAPSRIYVCQKGSEVWRHFYVRITHLCTRGDNAPGGFIGTTREDFPFTGRALEKGVRNQCARRTLHRYRRKAEK